MQLGTAVQQPLEHTHQEPAYLRTNRAIAQVRLSYNKTFVFCRYEAQFFCILFLHFESLFIYGLLLGYFLLAIVSQTKMMSTGNYGVWGIYNKIPRLLCLHAGGQTPVPARCGICFHPTHERGNMAAPFVRPAKPQGVYVCHHRTAGELCPAANGGRSPARGAASLRRRASRRTVPQTLRRGRRGSLQGTAASTRVNGSRRDLPRYVSFKGRCGPLSLPFGGNRNHSCYSCDKNSS